MRDDERVEGPYCYGTSSDPHTPVRTISATDAGTFRCPLCGREPDLADVAAEIAEERAKAASDARQRAPEVVVAGMQAGLRPDAIVSMLEERGLERNEAWELVAPIYADVVRVAEDTQYTSAALLPAIFGGLIGAVLAGIGWGLIVIASGYEIGYAATGVGVLAGVGVVLLARGRKGLPLQIVAVLASAVGVLIGKYLTFFYVYREAVKENAGSDAAADLSPFASKVFNAFTENLDVVFSGYDVLWIGLAAFAAWRIPRGLGLRVPA